MVGPLCFYCDCIFFQHLKMGLHVIINEEHFFGNIFKYSITCLELGKMKIIVNESTR
jgi:hypothetical protein